MSTWDPKDPDEVLDYSIDWSARLSADADEIEAVAWTIPDGVEKGVEGVEGAIATVWLSGGTAGQKYSIGCRVTTIGGRTYDVTRKLAVKSA